MFRQVTSIALLATVTMVSSPSSAEFSTDCVEQVAAGSLGDVTYVNVAMGFGSKKVSTTVLGPLYQMYLAAKNEGITLKLESAFRSSAEQQHLYDCYQGAMDNGCGSEPVYIEHKACPTSYCPAGCSSCNLAAKPGSSNHESGLAVDINTATGTNAAYIWLSKNGHENALKYGFHPISSEPWHFDYKGTTPWAGPCGGGGAVWQSICVPSPVTGAEAEIFKDMPPDAFAHDEAVALLAAGITTGCAPDLFCPGCVTTRAMAVTFLIRAAGIEVGGQPATPSFVDLTPGAYYVPYVEKAKELGIVQGCNVAEQKFCPDDPTKRNAFAKMLIETLDVPTVNPATPSFTDVAKGHWSYPYVETMKDLCITTGCSDTEFCPEEPATRAMAAVFITRAFDLLDANDCISYCDDIKCESSNYCEGWSACEFATTCAETGTRQQGCNTFTCEGPKTNALCTPTSSTETESCTRDTDGVETLPWSGWGPCVPTAPCATDGTEKRVRLVCEGGAEVEKVETRACSPSPDPDCEPPPGPDTGASNELSATPDESATPDASATPDSSSEDAGAKPGDIGAEDASNGPSPQADAVALDAEGPPISPRSGESEGCRLHRSPIGGSLFMLVLLGLWVIRHRRDHAAEPARRDSEA